MYDGNLRSSHVFTYIQIFAQMYTHISMIRHIHTYTPYTYTPEKKKMLIFNESIVTL